MAYSNSSIFLAVVAAIARIGSASTADLAVKARPTAVDPGYNWSGFYIGGNAGYGRGERSGELVAFSTGLGWPGGDREVLKVCYLSLSTTFTPPI